MAKDNLTKTTGVEQLIDRLKSDGVAKGKHEADAILTDAKKQALELVDAAQREADQILSEAKDEAERLRKTSGQALQLAGRDAMLKLRESFQLQFENRLRKLVGSSLREPDTLRKMILEVAGKNRPDSLGGDMQLLLPQAAGASDPLSSFVAGLTAEMLAEGVTFGVGEDVAAGVRVRLGDRDVDVDLSDEALAAFLSRFLIPRFRELMDFKS
jgi:V/A-type H+-transporting ATPase subunit E